jgi:[protein-PII] uridylyltransferase
VLQSEGLPFTVINHTGDMMGKIRKPRLIIERKEVIEALAACDVAGSPILPVLKEALAHGRAEIQGRFEESVTKANSGIRCVQEYAYLMDQLIRATYDHFASKYPPELASSISVVAVGGYGRAEMAPQSDVDLLFLMDDAEDVQIQAFVQDILYSLWDLGLKVGHATRTIADTLKQAENDITICTALLEARLIWGNKTMFATLMHLFRAEIVAGTEARFVDEKLAERDKRHDAMGDSRYVLEPNIKEGKGGLRDLHTLIWLVKYVYNIQHMQDLVDQDILSTEELRMFAKAENYLFTVRCQLHYLHNRPDERLTFDVQPILAEKLGYTDHAGTSGVERFMKHYYLTVKLVGDLTRIISAHLEEENKKKPFLSFSKPDFLTRTPAGFVAKGGRLKLAQDSGFEDDPVNLIRVFHAQHITGMDLHPETVRAVTEHLKLVSKIRRNKEANTLFLDILSSESNPEPALRKMNECGVFGRFVPDFGRVVAQMQYDMYHVYTVDEHTLRAISILHHIETGQLQEELPIASAVIGKIQSRRALYVAVFMHDIAKGRGGDHSVLGADVAVSLGKRFGLDPEETETVAWLVREHLTMSRIAFKRDIEDPKTIRDFAQVVQSPERLKLLLILTCADIRAVGPNVWNNWKAVLLRQLYNYTEEYLTVGVSSKSSAMRAEAQQEKVMEHLLARGWAPEEAEAHIGKGYQDYWLTYDLETQLDHADMVRQAKAEGLPILINVDSDVVRAATAVTVFTTDHPGLFSKIAGALALASCSIVDAKITTFSDGTAMDTFWVQNVEHELVSDPRQITKIKDTIEDVLKGMIYPDRELAKRPGRLPARAKVFSVAPRVLIDNTASKTYTVIEVNGFDRPGFLYQITATLTRLGLQISSAHISTYGERVVDVFYVKDIFGLKIDQKNKIQKIRTEVLDALTK